MPIKDEKVMNYQILFTDMDGTLLNEEKSISQDVLHAMTAYTNAGGQIVLSSGRPLSSILKVVDKLNLRTPNMYIIAYNGAMVYDLTNEKAILENRIPLPVVQKLLDMAHEMKLHCHTYSDTHIISEFDTPELHSYADHVKIPYLVKENAANYLASINSAPFKALALTLHDRKPLELYSAKVEAEFGDTIHTFFSQKYYLECCMKEASKGNAVRFLCDYLNIDVKKTVAAGDAANDISMLEAAGLSYAMQNGSEDVKKAATRITTKDNAHDGILEIFETL